MDETEVLALAQRIHKRRVYAHPGSLPARASAEALIAQAYGLELTIDSYDGAMNLLLEDESGNVVTVVCYKTAEPSMKLRGAGAADASIFIFATGHAFDEVEVLGWLPATRIDAAPKIPIGSSQFEYELRKEFMFELPDTFNFVEPAFTEMPRVWNYEMGGWWTPTGYLYDAEAKRQIEQLDVQLAG